jgi:exopolysaccharide biosynthesis polyprenyl glycosylphosphotransferase
MTSPRGTAQSPPPPAVSNAEQPPVNLVLPEHDVRRRKPPLLSFVLRWNTVRTLVRIGILLALDFIAIYGAILTALAVKAALVDGWNSNLLVHQAKHFVPLAYLVTTLLFARSGLYAERAARPGLARIVTALFQTMLVVLVFAVVNHQQFQSYYIFYGTLLFAVAYVCLLRFIYQRASGAILRRAGYQRRTVLVGTGGHIDAVAHALRGNAGDRHIVIGFVSLKPRPDNGLPSLGSIDDIGDIVSEHNATEVIIADPDFPQERAVELVDVCHGRGVQVRVAPSTMEILVHRAEFLPGQSLPLFELKSPVFDGFDYVLKRTFDIIVSGLLLIVLSPLLLVIALAIKVTSRGPVFYRSPRPGLGGATFGCMKFRTMNQDADRDQPELEDRNEASGALFKIRDDPRVTKVGRLLRRFSLDELAQLINVVRGEMSLVGPRPLPIRDYEQLEDWHKKRYLVLPGITGLWQISGRSDLDFDDLVRLDFVYLETWSVSLDLSILVKTVPAVLFRRGAY